MKWRCHVNSIELAGELSGELAGGEYQSDSRSRCAVSSDIEGLGSKLRVGGPAEKVALAMESVVDGRLNRQETLRRPR